MDVVDAVEADLTKITEIYNEVIRSSTAVFSDDPVTVEDRVVWWKARVAQGYPVLVARDENGVAGFATFGDFRAWPGYRFTVEGTIHIDASARRKGVGVALLAGADRARAGRGEACDGGWGGLGECGVAEVSGRQWVRACRASARGGEQVWKVPGSRLSAVHARTRAGW